MPKKKQKSLKRPDTIQLSHKRKMDTDELRIHQHIKRKGGHVIPSKKAYRRKEKHPNRYDSGC